MGDVDGTSSSPGLIEAALGVLDHGDYRVTHNHPFKGGYITRHFGKPARNRHTLQLEMSKINYMDDTETRYDENRATRMRKVLQKVFEKLIEQLS